MLPIDHDDLKFVRNPGRPDNEAALARPMHVTASLFKGWGPKLLAATLILSSIAVARTSASAATKVLAMTSCAANRGARLISHPEATMPTFASGGYGETTLRVRLNASGRVDSVAIAESSGNPFLDLTAARVALASRYEAATLNCEPAAAEFLYSVDFPE